MPLVGEYLGRKYGAARLQILVTCDNCDQGDRIGFGPILVGAPGFTVWRGDQILVPEGPSITLPIPTQAWSPAGSGYPDDLMGPCVTVRSDPDGKLGLYDDVLPCTRTP